MVEGLTSKAPVVLSFTRTIFHVPLNEALPKTDFSQEEPIITMDNSRKKSFISAVLNQDNYDRQSVALIPTILFLKSLFSTRGSGSFSTGAMYFKDILPFFGIIFISSLDDENY